jgi:hypothetical protein
MSTATSPGRVVRYQGAILQDGHLLLLRYRNPLTQHAFWLLPGGGQETGNRKRRVSSARCAKRRTWFNLAQPDTWGEDMHRDGITGQNSHT